MSEVNKPTDQVTSGDQTQPSTDIGPSPEDNFFTNNEEQPPVRQTPSLAETIGLHRSGSIPPWGEYSEDEYDIGE